ncbi:MAG: DoxX family membrane protein [Bacteroidaceae bacterium]|nr:DoxX family membrane protein [Bacteroidaceae bacterium]MBP5647134.1 DoxX family membrane protein [Bacteroidaceae bacterium]
MMRDKGNIKRSLPARISVSFCRVLVGVVFMFSGTVKAVDPVGTQIKLTDYMGALGMNITLPDSTLLIMACILAGMELLLGIYMTMGAYIRGTSLLLSLFLLVMTPFTLYLALANPVEDCGCFGDAVKLSNWQTFWKNVFLLALTLYVFIRRRLSVPFAHEKIQWVLTLVSMILIIKFMVSNIKYLPAIDFRPYKTGTDLRRGVLQGENPGMADFFIMDSNLDDVTSDILNEPGYTFLVVSPHLESANERNIDLIDDIYDYCRRWGYGMYGLTSSGSGAVHEWTENTGAEYGFLHCDEIPLETMVRSNPGLVLLHDGVLVNKWSYLNIPDETRLSGPLDVIEAGKVPAPDPMRTPLGIALLFLLPMLIIGLISLVKSKIL